MMTTTTGVTTGTGPSESSSGTGPFAECDCSVGSLICDDFTDLNDWNEVELSLSPDLSPIGLCGPRAAEFYVQDLGLWSQITTRREGVDVTQGWVLEFDFRIQGACNGETGNSIVLVDFFDGGGQPVDRQYALQLWVQDETSSTTAVVRAGIAANVEATPASPPIDVADDAWHEGRIEFSLDAPLATVRAVIDGQSWDALAPTPPNAFGGIVDVTIGNYILSGGSEGGCTVLFDRVQLYPGVAP